MTRSFEEPPLHARTLCLGALTEGAASGYEIRKLLMERFGHFMNISYGSIYPALASLMEDGLVECKHVPQHNRPDKKTYRITDAGREALIEALRESPGRHRVRSEFLALLCFSHYLPGERLQQVLDEREQEFLTDLADAEEWLRERGDSAPAGMRFAVGFAAAVLRASCTYLAEHRHTLIPAS